MSGSDRVSVQRHSNLTKNEFLLLKSFETKPGRYRSPRSVADWHAADVQA